MSFMLMSSYDMLFLKSGSEVVDEPYLPHSFLVATLFYQINKEKKTVLYMTIFSPTQGVA